MPIPQYVDEDTLNSLDEATFVVIATDDAGTKASNVTYLEQREIPFIDVGMGIEEVDSKLTGLPRITTSLPRTTQQPRPGEQSQPRSCARTRRLRTKLQIADLNSLNAQLAIMRWKRYLGLYAASRTKAFLSCVT